MYGNAGKLQKPLVTDTDAGYFKQLQGIPASQDKTELCHVFEIFCVCPFSKILAQNSTQLVLGESDCHVKLKFP